VSAGDEITVKVLRVDEATGKISLGTKQLSEDPWATAALRYEAGQAMTGRVTRHAQFGAFVELEPGIEALAHASTFAATGRRDDWKTAVPVGATARFEIVSLDLPRRRIGVVLMDDGGLREQQASEAADVREYRARADAGGATSALAEKLRDALSSRKDR
jgi:small subunit ribosomal protein S1